MLISHNSLSKRAISFIKYEFMYIMICFIIWKYQAMNVQFVVRILKKNQN